jgi:hypothetical protein
MRADKWQGFTPASFKAQMNDKAVCLFGTGGNLRFDFRGDRTAAISTFSVTNGTQPAIWSSKSFDMPKPTAWYACRIVTYGKQVRLQLFGDGVKVVDGLYSTDHDILLPRMPKAWRWAVRVQTSHEIRSITLATNRREL